jgi:phage terminase large subunit-like protein
MTNPWPPRFLTSVSEEAIERGRAAEPIIEFINEYGIVTKDSVAGKAGSPLILRDWQKTLLEHIFAWDKDGLKHRISLVGMPRKGGKSSLGSAMSLYSLILGPAGGEVYSVAAEKEQARIVFREARRMVEASEQLSSLCTLYRDAIEIPGLHSVYRVLSAEAFSKEGLNPHFVLFDELHAQPNRELFDVMSLAMGARGKLASLVAITTAGVKIDSTGRDSIAYSLYNYGKRVASGEIDDPTFFLSWWEASEDMDYRSEETWKIANPGYGDLTSIEDFKSAVRRTPEAEFRTKRCNQWVSSAIAWLPNGAWDACAADFEINPDDEIVLGFDGSFSGDASVIVGATIPQIDGEPIRVFMVKAWEKSEEDDDDWRVDIAEVEETIINFCKEHRNVREIACDPFRWQRSMQILENMGLPIVEWPSTSPRRMVPACAKFYDAVVEKRIVHDGNPVLSRHLDNAVTKIDNLGPRIVKEKRDSPRKIDAAVAAVLAFDRASIGKIDEVVPEFFG